MPGSSGLEHTAGWEAGLRVYLFNAARPGSALVQIKGQKRNENQSTGEIAFDFHPTPILVEQTALFADSVLNKR
jgi:hypothetical protein